MNVHEGSAQEWFDQFPPLENAADWPSGSQWCPRHWAPCPLLGANGLGASTELMQVFINEMKPIGAVTPVELNSALAEASPLCCRLGDERMYQIWGDWPPAQGDTPSGESV